MYAYYMSFPHFERHQGKLYHNHISLMKNLFSHTS